MFFRYQSSILAWNSSFESWCCCSCSVLSVLFERVVSMFVAAAGVGWTGVSSMCDLLLMSCVVVVEPLVSLFVCTWSMIISNGCGACGGCGDVTGWRVSHDAVCCDGGCAGVTTDGMGSGVLVTMIVGVVLESALFVWSCWS